jgi:hypothetical protein
MNADLLDFPPMPWRQSIWAIQAELYRTVLIKVWVISAGVKPLIATPIGGPETRLPRWARLLAIVMVSALVASVALIWALGGFESRRDYIWLPPGQDMDAGNLVFVLNSATARRNYSGDWDIRVSGTVRNPHNEALGPKYGADGNLVVSAAYGTESGTLDWARLGGSSDRTLVPPSNRPIDLLAVFTIKGRYPLGDTLFCGVSKMEYSDAVILGLGSGPYWHTDSAARFLATRLPVTIVKDD